MSARYDIDFNRNRRPVGRIAWLLLAVGAVAALLAAVELRDRWDAAARQEAEGERLAEAVRAAGGRVNAAGRDAAGPRDEGVRAQRQLALRVVGDLRRPWRELFEQLEAAHVGGVHLVQLGVDARFRTLQLQVEARDLHQVLRYLQRLPGSGPVVAVQLVSHEWRDAPAGRVLIARLSGELDAGGEPAETPAPSRASGTLDADARERAL